MGRRIPPLNAVRAFEVAARQLSFRRAADELCVTAAAVSQQVRLLEDHLGHALFERRKGGGLELTESGKLCVMGLKGVFDTLADIFARLESKEADRGVTILVAPSLCIKWLVPRLAGFQRMHPRIDVRLLTNVTGRFHEPGDHDLAIYYTPGSYSGMQVVRLMEEEIYPVCSPRLLDGARPLRTPADLCAHTLLHDETMRAVRDHPIRDFPTWQDWLDAANVHGIDTSHGPRLEMSSIVTDAAIAGSGVALGRSCIVHDALRTGGLVRPFDIPYPKRFAYFLVWVSEAAKRPSVAVFRDWLVEEARRTEAERTGDVQVAAPASVPVLI